MNKYTIIIYAIIVGAAILSSILKKRKKSGTANNTGPKKIITNYNQPTTSIYKKPSTTQPKTLEDILQNLLNGPTPQKVVQPKVEEKMPDRTLHSDGVFTDKQPQKYTTLEDVESLESLEELDKQEVEYYNNDKELEYKDEMVDYDKTTDHRVHGAGFEDIKFDEPPEVESEWSNIDWRKAIITAEILKRHKY